LRIVDLIAKKRDGQSLTTDEINWFITNYTNDTIPDYQVSALLMAILLRGMSRAETVSLTMAMAESGDMLDLSGIVDYAIDKHSSGGVGDKTSLVVLPVVASFGVPIAKMSGRGLGFSGGTLDKLESITGFNVNLDDAEFRRLAKDTGLVLAGQTKSLAPADGKLYALRDVTATVESLPLIASSIMSKKLAAGANGIVLDVKLGHGAFMKTLESAKELATIMVQIGVDAGRDMVALLSDMNQPLGVAVGNALEVAEAVKTLQGHGPDDFHAHCVEVAAYMLKLAGQGEKWADIEANRADVDRVLKQGQGFDRFRQMIVAQGGDVGQVDDLSKLPQATLIEPITAEQSGYIQDVFADKVGIASLALGAGREKKGDPIDFAVGIEVHVSVGDHVNIGDTLMTLHANDAAALDNAKQILSTSLTMSDATVAPIPLFYGVVDGADV
jgi:pyrimidine-nucleoside phosphorylase